MKIGQFLKVQRKDICKMSPEEWGDIFGKSSAYVYRVERGEQQPDEQYLQDIHRHFDCEVLGAYICGINDYKLQRSKLHELAKSFNVPVLHLRPSYEFV